MPTISGTTHSRAGMKINAKRRFAIDERTIRTTPLADSMWTVFIKLTVFCHAVSTPRAPSAESPHNRPGKALSRRPLQRRTLYRQNRSYLLIEALYNFKNYFYNNLRKQRLNTSSSWYDRGLNYRIEVFSWRILEKNAYKRRFFCCPFRCLPWC